MTDADVDISDSPEINDKMWVNGILRRGLKPIVRKKQITLRIDNDVLDFFKSQGQGYQTRINQLLRAYMEEVKKLE